MGLPEVVLDTNVVVSGLRSRHGNSFHLLSLIGTGHFEINLSVPLLLEYEATLKRSELQIPLSHKQIDDVLNFYCSVGRWVRIHYLWRPLLPDAKDDFVAELAVAGQCDYIVTFNERDFRGVQQFGVHTCTPDYLLQVIEDE